MRFVNFIILFLFLPQITFARDWKGGFIQALKNGGAYVVDENGNVVLDHRSSDFFIPASTLKIATSAMALKYLGTSFRFPTEFYLTDDKKLVVKGYGDPAMISEELLLIATNLKNKNLKSITGVILDTTYFDPNAFTDGTAQNERAYSALNGALIANFNTIYVNKIKKGVVVSAEPQTPLTPIAKERGKFIGLGKVRINLGESPKIGAYYFGELLVEFLKLQGIEVTGSIILGEIPTSAKKIYVHQSSKTLTQNVTDLLEFSTNFMANQLFLVVGAHLYGAPATVEKGQKSLTQFLTDEVGWQNFKVYEGAGLSTHNKVNAKQMMQLLNYFEPYRHLLPDRKKVFRAKTGTLTGVNAYAGYMENQTQWYTFVILVNDTVPYDYKFELADQLYLGITGHLPPSLK